MTLAVTTIATSGARVGHQRDGATIAWNLMTLAGAPRALCSVWMMEVARYGSSTGRAVEWSRRCSCCHPSSRGPLGAGAPSAQKRLPHALWLNGHGHDSIAAWRAAPEQWQPDADVAKGRPPVLEFALW